MISNSSVSRLANRDGFVLPAVLFALVVMSIVAVAAVRMADDEHRASRAMRESGAALYAAEAGLHLLLGTVVDTTGRTLIDSIAGTLSPGDSSDLGWSSLPNRTAIRGVLLRCDDGGQPLYALTVEGHGAGPLAGMRVLRLFLTQSPSSSLAQALLVDGDLTISGNATIQGGCADVHANGLLRVSGTLTTDGMVSAVKRVAVSGSIVDAEGNPVTPQSKADPMDIPKLNPMDYCDEADFMFRNGWVIEVATSDSGYAGSDPVHGWKSDGSTYTTNSNISPGTICADGDITVSIQLGMPGAPLSLSVLTTGSVTISEDPYLVPDHSSGIAIVAAGDLKLSGSPAAGTANYAGLFYAGSQCKLSGDPVLHGQLVCHDDPNPSGSENTVSENKISGDAVISYDCSSYLGDGTLTLRPLRERAWREVW